MEVCRRITISVLGFLVFLISSAAVAYEVQGTITVTAPYPEPLRVKNERAKEAQMACPEEYVSQNLMISAKGHLKNAVVSLKGNFPDARNRNEDPIPLLDQKGCNFEPHILIVLANHSFQVANSDPMVHDVRIFEQSEMLNRFEMKAYGKTVEQRMEAPGIYVLRCGLHPWMYAFVVVAPHTYYAVTDEEGRFKLENVPAGNYHLRIWHEQLGEVELPLEVNDSILDFSYQYQ